MKQRPIIFNGEMVQAILAGNKTQTRRIIKNFVIDFDIHRYFYTGKFRGHYPDDLPEFIEKFCPFGKVGDQLYVRETFRYFNKHDECSCYEICQCPKSGFVIYKATDADCGSKWKPAIHMQKSASRITLEITDIRVERLQDISEQDCLAEGIGSPFTRDCKKPQFQQLWNSIYNNWNDNPYVFVISFKRI